MSVTDPTVIAALRARIWALERTAAACAAVVPVAAGIDKGLPWGGLPLACLHDIIAEDAAATGFLALLLGRLERSAPVLWCQGHGAGQMLYPAGLAAFGLGDERLIVVRGAGRDLLWAAEEGLRCSSLAAVIIEGTAIDLTAGRRLQLAAETGRGVGFALLPRGAPPSSAATTRWRVASAASTPPPWHGIGPPRWHLSLERCRGGGAAHWLVEWRSESGELVATPDGRA